MMGALLSDDDDDGRELEAEMEDAMEGDEAGEDEEAAEEEHGEVDAEEADVQGEAEGDAEGDEAGGEGEEGEEEEEEEEEEDQDGFFEEFERELMEAGDDADAGTPRETPRAGGHTPKPSLPAPQTHSLLAELGEDMMTPIDQPQSFPAEEDMMQEEEEEEEEEEEAEAHLESQTPVPADGMGEHEEPQSPGTAPGSAQPPGMQEEQPEGNEQMEQERQARRNRTILKKLNEKQLNQYEAYRRSKFDFPSMKRLIQYITMKSTAFNVNDKNLLVIISGVAKICVGEMVETARAIATSQGHQGALLPSHIRAAYAKMDAKGKMRHHQGPRRMKL